MLPLFIPKRPKACTHFFLFMFYGSGSFCYEASFLLASRVLSLYTYIEGIYILGKNDFRTRDTNSTFYTRDRGCTPDRKCNTIPSRTRDASASLDQRNTSSPMDKKSRRLYRSCLRRTPFSITIIHTHSDSIRRILSCIEQHLFNQ